MKNRRRLVWLVLPIAVAFALVFLPDPESPEMCTDISDRDTSPPAPIAGPGPANVPPPSHGEEPEATSGPVGRLMLSGRVVLADGSPAPGAIVSVDWAGSALQGRPRSRLDFEDVLTDDDGRYGFRDATGRRRLPWPLRVTARRGATMTISEEIVEPVVSLEMPDLVLHETMEVRIRVVDARLEPIAGAEVQVRLEREGDRALTFEGVSDLDGLLVRPFLAPRADWAIRLEVEHEAHPAVAMALPAAVPLAGETFEVILPTGMEVRGRVVLDDGSAARRVRVIVAVNGSPVHHLQTAVDDDGGFVLRGVPPRGARLFLYPGWRGKLGYSQTNRALPVRTEEIRGRHGGVVDVGAILIPALGTVRGTVVGRDGQPVSGAKVWVWYEGRGYQGQRSATTGRDGRFEITKVPPGDLRLLVNKTYRSRGTLVAEKAPVHSGDDVHIEIRGGAAIVLHFHSSGRRDAELPVSEPDVAWQRLRRPGEPGGGFDMRGPLSIGVRFGSRAHWRYSVSPGRYRVTVTVSGYRPVDFSEVLVTEDRDTDLDVYLEKE